MGLSLANQIRRAWQTLRQNGRWLTPGIGIKRWILIVLLGITLIGVGLALFLFDIYRTMPDIWWLPYISTVSLRFLDRPLRILIFGGVGLGIILFGTWRLNRALILPFVRPG